MIHPKYYIPVQTPYPAYLFAVTHPLRPAGKTDLSRLFRQQRTVGVPAKRINLKEKNGEMK